MRPAPRSEGPSAPASSPAAAASCSPRRAAAPPPPGRVRGVTPRPGRKPSSSPSPSSSSPHTSRGRCGASPCAEEAAGKEGGRLPPAGITGQLPAAPCITRGGPFVTARGPRTCPRRMFAPAACLPRRSERPAAAGLGGAGGGGGEDDGRTTTATGRREATRRGGGRKPLPAGAAAGRGRRGPGGPPRSAWRRKAPLHRPPAAPSPPAVSRSAFAEGGGTGRPRRCVPPRRRERPGRYPEPRQRARGGGGGTHADRPRDPPARRGSARSRPGPGCPASPWPRAGASRRRRAPPAGAASPAGAELPRPLPAGTRQRAEPRAPCAAAPRVRRRAQRDRPFRSAGTARRSFVGAFAEGGVAGGSRWREPCVSPRRGGGGGSWAEPFCCCDFSSEVGKGTRTQLKRPGERLIGRRGLVLAALAASLSGCRYPFSPPRPVSPSLPPALRRRARFAERRLQNRSVGGQWARVGFCGVFFLTRLRGFSPSYGPRGWGRSCAPTRRAQPR